MDQQLIEWLNNRDRTYPVGVQLCKKYRPDLRIPPIAGLVRRSDTDFLYEALKSYYYEQKKAKITEPIGVKKNVENSINKMEQSLLDACKLEADKSYKLMQHARGQLFALCPINKDPNENNPLLVEQRNNLAKLLLELQAQTDHNYELYRYVLQNNKLPEANAHEEKINPFPEDKVERFKMLTNLRKNYNKLKRKESTPERVAKIHEHLAKIKVLEDEFGKSK